MSRTSRFTLFVLVTLPLFNVTTSGQTELRRTFETEQGDTMEYRLWLPPGHDQPGKTFPLLVLTDGRALGGVDPPAGLIAASQTERFASFILSPALVPPDLEFSTCVVVGFDPIVTSCPPGTKRSLDFLEELIHELPSEFAIDPEQRTAFGASGGGISALEAMLKKPGLFSTAIISDGGYARDVTIPPLDGRFWFVNGHSDSVILADTARRVVQAINDQGGSAIYLEDEGGHAFLPDGTHRLSLLFDDADNEFYPWLFEDVAPQLGRLLYDPATGNVSIDAGSAPGGVISSLELTPHTPISGAAEQLLPPSIDEINGVPLFSSESLISWSDAEGFEGIVNLGGILPPALDFDGLHDYLEKSIYQTPKTGNSDRVFMLAVAESVLGDLNGDSAVDAADASIMFGNWGTNGTGDVNGDGIVDAADAGIMFTDWTGDSKAVQNVPEPSSLWLAVLGLLPMLHLGRRQP